LITFLLNQQEHTVENIDPNTTVLDYLREQLHKTGTKEGCASGDCGACTVVVATVDNGNLQYQAINACITPLATLHGKQLITVEDLKQGEQLHPVQQAMVDCHGSQCGFCTPGFVMSMFAYRKNHSDSDKASATNRENINEALGGNLCRCTGYHPIIDAAVQMFDPKAEDQFSATEQTTINELTAIQQDDQPVTLSSKGRDYYAPSNVKDLAELMLANPKARLVAGGTDLSLEFTQFLRNIDTLIYTGRVAELKTINETEQSLSIGAAVTYTDAKSQLVALYPDLHELIDRLGSRQIRNQGTIGGNVGNASPIGDMPPVLIALNAELILRKGERSRRIAVADYFVSYKVTAQETSEFIERIIIPKPAAGYNFKVYKISKRLEDDISATCGAFNIKVENGAVTDALIAFGGMAEIAKRASHCEQALINQAWNDETIDKAMAALANDFAPISDFRASAEYRLKVSQNMLRRYLLEHQTSTQTLRVTHYA
tara:strand:- start:16956 stop:18416 length:1461 start_codon:yes stop_codon:yes gene_type:complete